MVYVSGWFIAEVPDHLPGRFVLNSLDNLSLRKEEKWMFLEKEQFA